MLPLAGKHLQFGVERGTNTIKAVLEIEKY